MKIGDKVKVSGGKLGIIKYVGPTEFASGDWIGVELENSSGKNDGSVNGKQYFNCPPSHGLFVKKSQVTLRNSTRKSSRIQELKNKGQCKMPVKISSSDVESKIPVYSSKNDTDAGFNTLVDGVLHEKITKNEDTTVSTSIAGPTAATVKALHTEPQKQKTQSEEDQAQIPETVKLQNKAQKDVIKTECHSHQDYETEIRSLRAGFEQALKSVENSESCQRKRAEDLQNQLEIIKTQNMEHIESGAAKLSASLRMKDQFEEKVAELQDEIEILKLDNETLVMDKEMAEERVDELESQMAQLANSNSLGSPISNDMNINELTEQNRKLRNAVKSLHNGFSQEKSDMQKQIHLQAKRIEKLQTFEVNYMELQQNHNKALDQIVELKEQLDVASGYERMVESLTEKNLHLEDRAAELEQNVISLESLRETSDEMEEQHAEYEAELRADVNLYVSRIHAMKEVLKKQKALNEEKDRTIERFREVLHQNHSELSSLKAESVEDLEVPNLQLRSFTVSEERLSKIPYKNRQIMSTRFKTEQLVEKLSIEASYFKMLLPVALMEKNHAVFELRLLVSTTCLTLRHIVDFIENKIPSFCSTDVADQLLPNDLHLLNIARQSRYKCFGAFLRLSHYCELHSSFLNGCEISKKALLEASSQFLEQYSELEIYLKGVLAKISEEDAVKNICSIAVGIFDFENKWKTEINDHNVHQLEERSGGKNVILPKISLDSMVLHVLFNCCEISEILGLLNGNGLATLTNDNSMDDLIKLAQISLSDSLSLRIDVRNAIRRVEGDYLERWEAGGRSIDQLNILLEESKRIKGSISQLIDSEEQNNFNGDLDIMLVEKLQEFNIELHACHKIAKAGELGFSSAGFGKAPDMGEMRPVPRWKLVAAETRSDFESAMEASCDIANFNDEFLLLRAENENCESELSKCKVVRDKNAEELKHAVEKNLTFESKVKAFEEIIKSERENFNKTLARLSSERDAIEQDNQKFKDYALLSKDPASKPVDRLCSHFSARKIKLHEPPIGFPDALSLSRQELASVKGIKLSLDINLLGSLPHKRQKKKLDINTDSQCDKLLKEVVKKLLSHQARPVLVELNSNPLQQRMSSYFNRGKLIVKYRQLMKVYRMHNKAHESEHWISHFKETIQPRHKVILANEASFQAKVLISCSSKIQSQVAVDLRGWRKLHQVFG